jgi:hypothetical protein
LIVFVLGLVAVGVLGGGASIAASNGAADTRASDGAASESPRGSGDSRDVGPSLPTATSVSTTPEAEWPTSWLDVLRALDKQRSAAFKSGDDARLDSVYVRGSVPWKADRQLLATYRNQHVRIEGLTMEIRSVLIESEETNHAVIQVVDRLVSGAAVDQQGRRTTFIPGKPTARRITLEARTPGTWRIAEITTR